MNIFGRTYKVPDDWFPDDTLRFDGEFYLEINGESYCKWLFEIKAISPDRKRMILYIRFPFKLNGFIEVKFSKRWVRRLNNLSLYDRKKQQQEEIILNKINDWSEYNRSLIDARNDYQNALEKIKKEYL